MKRYPEYKESGVKWIGEIPKDWNAVPLTKYLESIIDYRGRTPEKMENGRFLVTAKNIRNGQIDYEISQEFTSEDEYQRLMTRGVPQIGDVLFTTEAPLGEVANVDDISIALAQRVIKFRPKPDFLNPYFLKYWILSYSFQSDLQRYATGSTARGIKASKLCLLKLNLPPLKEQEQIANFLDRKTEQINELIRIKERQIKLLQEQRTALINQTVTKGLDPNVEMKPSGVEWIGEIPAHWEVKRLKHVAKILPSNVDKHIYPNEIQVRLCNYTDVYYNDYITVDTVLKKGSCKESEFAKFALRKGDVIITKDSETPDDIGVPTYVKDDLDSVVCGYHLTMIRPLTCRGEYIFRFIQSDRTRRYFELESNGITRYGLGKPSIENLRLPIPPDPEQCQIANFLDRKTKQIDELIAAEQRKIELLKEYRQSLISEAVTGKIDVRNEV